VCNLFGRFFFFHYRTSLHFWFAYPCAVPFTVLVSIHAAVPVSEPRLSSYLCFQVCLRRYPRYSYTYPSARLCPFPSSHHGLQPHPYFSSRSGSYFFIVRFPFSFLTLSSFPFPSVSVLMSFLPVVPFFTSRRCVHVVIRLPAPSSCSSSPLLWLLDSFQFPPLFFNMSTLKTIFIQVLFGDSINSYMLLMLFSFSFFFFSF
jgi:hypothetical protein